MDSAALTTSMNNPLIWILAGVIVLLITHLIGTWFQHKSLVCDATCKERMTMSEKFNEDKNMGLEKKIDYLIVRVDSYFKKG